MACIEEPVDTEHSSPHKVTTTELILTKLHAQVHAYAAIKLQVRTNTPIAILSLCVFFSVRNLVWHTHTDFDENCEDRFDKLTY